MDKYSLRKYVLLNGSIVEFSDIDFIRDLERFFKDFMKNFNIIEYDISKLENELNRYIVFFKNKCEEIDVWKNQNNRRIY